MVKGEHYLVWLGPWLCELPHRITNISRVKDIATSLKFYGWDLSRPALVGYLSGDKIQLLTGTHRCAAARMADVEMPVVVWDESYIRAIWGHEAEWRDVMESGNDWSSL